MESSPNELKLGRKLDDNDTPLDVACLSINKSDFIEILVSGENITVHETWLRHHCRCSECFSCETIERIVIPNKTWLALKIGNVTQDDNDINLEWTDGHKSKFNKEWLLRCTPRTDSLYHIPLTRARPLFGPGFRSTNNPLKDVSVDYHEVMESEHGVAKVLSHIAETGFAVISNVNGLEGTKLAHDQIGHAGRTIFGDGVGVLQPNAELYSTGPLPLHTDTTFFTEPMGLQLFHMIQRAEVGGQNCFSDGFLAAKILYEQNPEYYDVLAKTPLQFQYLEEGRRDFRATGVTLASNGITGLLEQVRYNPCLLLEAISHIPNNRILLFYEALIRYTELLNENKIWIQLEPGQLFLLDNWRILHGRSGFTGRRALAWAYFQRSDWLSRARVLGVRC